jgi:hypothetical protein
MFILLTDLKIAGIDMKYIRCDNSGENKAFYYACNANTTLCSSSQVQELIIKTEMWNGSFKHSMAGLEPC